ncbi:MAG: roadblock/LC7 domain-containing protein [Azonexus sp.]|nr:roadblock/LC7 domain-containing protein [Azonexus sp.]
MSSEALGHFVLPAMKQLYQRIPQLTAAVLCTPDGFNICSFGLDEKQVGKLAALSGSLLSVGNATMAELRLGLDEPMDLLMLKAGTFQILGLKVPKPDGHLVLMVAAKNTMLGLMIVGAQYVAGEIEKLFRAEAQT